ncbi:MAG: WD40/YVTN/BNR-like repeat-containing protein [Gaiellales bacterium]
MAKTKTKTKRAAPARVQSPRPARPRHQRDWPFWLAAAVPFVLAGALGIFLVSQRDAGSTADLPPASTLPATPDYHSLLVGPANPDRLWLGTHAGLHESTDGGRSWAETGLAGRDAMNLARSPGGAKTVWAAGHLVFAKSTDGGESWADVSPRGLPSLDIHGFATDPRNPQTLWAAVVGEGLFRSRDGGRSFALVSSQVGPGVMALGVRPDGRVLAGDMQQGLMSSKDGGESWTQVLAEGPMGLAINPRTPSQVLATGQSGIWSSSDGGSTWRIVHPVLDGAGPVAWAPSAPATAYAVGFDRMLYKTENAGVSWRPVS